ncbi:MAG: M23 family metallopeptidase [Holosporales bacterium]|jgi:murein DD-endopeptidase MepM/ murein hydrolase activator NlpD|nr:M23 family metallopeptidase [Holosporales bacterium]
MMMNRGVISLLCFVCFLAGCSTGDKEIPEVEQRDEIEPYHTVTEGDTVESVAAKYGMTRHDLVGINDLRPPYQLYDGQRLVVHAKPRGDSVAGPESSSDSGVELPSVEAGEPEAAETDEQQPPEKEPPQQREAKSKYIWPIALGSERISKHFSGDGGIIFDVSAGTPVKAIADGVVIIAGTPNGEAAAYGKTIVIKHKNMMSIYAFLKEVKVRANQNVRQGDIIGLSGQSGTIAKVPQVYFEMNDTTGKLRVAKDPEKELSKEN